MADDDGAASVAGSVATSVDSVAPRYAGRAKAGAGTGADSDEEEQPPVSLHYGPMWISGKLRYNVFRVRALQKFLMRKDLEVETEELKYSEVETAVLVEDSNVEKIEIRLYGEKSWTGKLTDIPPEPRNDDPVINKILTVLVAAFGPL